MYKYSTERVM